MRLNKWFSCRLLVGFVAAGLVAAAEPMPQRADGQRATAQFRAFHLGSVESATRRDAVEPMPDPATVVQHIAALRDDGTWPDIDYASQARSGWPPLLHWLRMKGIALTAIRPAATPANRAAGLAALHRAFAHWIAHDYQCPNWWYNEIGIPKEVGTVALLLGAELTPAEHAYVTGVSLARHPIGMTGQNRVWLAGNALMRGLLLGDDAMVAEASGVIWNELRVSTGEGIQPDFSFHQHGPQQQFGNYGLSFAVELARWAGILRGTRWALADEPLEVFRRYLLEGQAWISWRGAMDVSACARQLMPRSPRSKTATIARVMQQAAEFDRARASDYRAFVERNRAAAPNDLVGQRYYWRSDYLVHRRPSLMATLKMSSNRVIGAEVVNSENLSGYHTADGVLLLYHDNQEYEEIFPLWDWRKLPGVTCAQAELPVFKTAAVPRDFVGGVSDGLAGCAALDYGRDGVQAKKAWFFSGDTVVCLGTDIHASVGVPIATTLNQTRLRGPVQAHADGVSRTLDRGAHRLTEVQRIEHDGWRYTLLEAGALQLQTGEVTGHWRRVLRSPDTPPADVTGELFTLWIDHGQDPRGASYAYVVAPVASARAAEVMENTPAMQAVQMSDGRAGVVFWRAGEVRLPGGRRLAVSEPCLLLAGPEGVRVVDPTQKLATLTLTIEGEPRPVTLPAGADAGTAVLIAW